MELIDGESLTATLGRAPMPWARLSAIAEQICARARRRARRRHHPPRSQARQRAGRARPTGPRRDHRLRHRARADDASVTQVGAVVGTPRYMAPEQLAGGELDARADLFSLGVMLFELATGRAAVGRRQRGRDRGRAGDAADAPARRADPPIPAASRVIVRCLAARPAKRPAAPPRSRAAIAIGGARCCRPGCDRRRAPRSRAQRDAIAAAAAPITRADDDVAVLPIACAPGDEYLADGVVDDLIDTLSTTVGAARAPGRHRATRRRARSARDRPRSSSVDHVVDRIAAPHRRPGCGSRRG